MDIKVTGCGDCPFQAGEEDNVGLCSLSMNTGGYEYIMVFYEGVDYPAWCPLQSDNYCIELKNC